MPRQLSVLIVEDEESDALLEVRALEREGYEVTFDRVEGKPEMEAALREKEWDLVLSDYQLPGFDAPGALHVLQDSGLDIPFLVVSGKVGEESAVALMKQGAHDFLQKGNLTRLPVVADREIQEARERAERRRADERLRVSLREKEVMLKEIHHRVKNNLQVISSLLHLQAEHHAQEDLKRLLQESGARVRAMALVHDQLYRSASLSTIDFSLYTRRLGDSLMKSSLRPNVAVKVDMNEITLGIDMAIPCGLIVTELVSNSLKHGFPHGESGEVLVRMTLEGEKRYVLSVADSGKGFPQGFNPADARTLGMKLVSTLVDQLEGSISWSNHVGASVRIEFAEVK